MIRGIRLVDGLVIEFGGQIMRLQGVLKTMAVDRDGQSERTFGRGRLCFERVMGTEIVWDISVGHQCVGLSQRELRVSHRRWLMVRSEKLSCSVKGC